MEFIVNPTSNSQQYQEQYATSIQKTASILEDLKKRVAEPQAFLEWIYSPNYLSEKELEAINQQAERLSQYEKIIVIGIGGSYIGAKAFIDVAQQHHFKQEERIIFAGHHLDESYLNDLLDYLDDKDFALIVISKSGGTLEPALAFRLLKDKIREKYSESAFKERIVTITDAQKGELRAFTEQHQCNSFVVPDNIGGRFSVLSPVGLLPMAVAGIDIMEFPKHLKQLQQKYLKAEEQNPVLQYAVWRNLLYNNQFAIELLVFSNPKLQALAEWWKQLFGESEGKEGKGIFPASLQLSTDLHSLGQYVQEGKKHLFETFVRIKNNANSLHIQAKSDKEHIGDFLANKTLHYINSCAEQGTIKAHSEKGEVPVFEINIEELNPKSLMELIYFFELSCAVSASLLGVNPFNQPGVEAYKQNIYDLLQS